MREVTEGQLQKLACMARWWAHWYGLDDGETCNAITGAWLLCSQGGRPGYEWRYARRAAAMSKAGRDMLRMGTPRHDALYHGNAGRRVRREPAAIGSHVRELLARDWVAVAAKRLTDEDMAILERVKQGDTLEEAGRAVTGSRGAGWRMARRLRAALRTVGR